MNKKAVERVFKRAFAQMKVGILISVSFWKNEQLNFWREYQMNSSVLRRRELWTIVRFCLFNTQPWFKTRNLECSALHQWWFIHLMVYLYETNASFLKSNVCVQKIVCGQKYGNVCVQKVVCVQLLSTNVTLSTNDFLSTNETVPDFRPKMTSS